jgi:hypothetical protein
MVTYVMQTLSRIESGDPNAVEQLLPQIYDEQRQLVASRLLGEIPGQLRTLLGVSGTEVALAPVSDSKRHASARPADISTVSLIAVTCDTGGKVRCRHCSDQICISYVGSIFPNETNTTF